MNRFYGRMFIMAQYSSIQLFINYIVMFMGIEFAFYILEAIAEVNHVTSWYDYLLMITTVWLFIFNIEYVFNVLKGKE